MYESARDASVSKKRKTKQHLKYDQLCHEKCDKPKQHANKKQEPGSCRKFASKEERKVQRMKEKANVW